MLFTIKEKEYPIKLANKLKTEKGEAEKVMIAYFEDKGYDAIHHDFYLFHKSKDTKYPENENTLKEIIGEQPLSHLRELKKKLFPQGIGPNLAPEQPDLFVYNEKKSEYFFCEVKKPGDRLRRPQMVGISLIHLFLDCDITVALVTDPQKNVEPRTYRWVWPCVQECGFLEKIIEQANWVAETTENSD